MKKLLASIAAVLMLGLPASAGDLDNIKLTLTDVTTGTTHDVVSSDRKLSGASIDAIYLDITGAATVSVSVVSDTNNAAMASQTILAITNLSADAWYYPRHTVTSNASGTAIAWYEPYTVVGTKLLLRAGEMTPTNTNCNVSATIVFENK